MWIYIAHRGTSNALWRNWPEKQSKKRKIRAYAIQGHRGFYSALLCSTVVLVKCVRLSRLLAFERILNHCIFIHSFEVGINRKAVWDLVTYTILLVTDILVPFRSYRNLLFKFWTLRFWAPALGGLGTMYDVHLKARW